MLAGRHTRRNHSQAAMHHGAEEVSHSNWNAENHEMVADNAHQLSSCANRTSALRYFSRVENSGSSFPLPNSWTLLALLKKLMLRPQRTWRAFRACFHQLQNKPWASLYVACIFFMLFHLVVAFYAIQQYSSRLVSSFIRVMQGFPLIYSRVLLFSLYFIICGFHFNHIFVWLKGGNWSWKYKLR
jgi:hypothetical protein